jgi:predicted YcjX-like family ATPase
MGNRTGANAPLQLTTITDETRLALSTLGERTFGLVTPTVRLGVTGLAHAGKTVFITALVHNLIHGGRLPLFKSYASGRVSGAALEPQPDDAVPRFDYEQHVAALVSERVWPDSTRQISELRLTVRYESASFLGRAIGSGRVHIDIIDYPGEWLLDLPLLGKSYADWSAGAVAKASTEQHRALAATWLAQLAAVDPNAPENETTARELSSAFTAYLRALRSADGTVATEPPGRFLMPGDLDNSPALTFAPLNNVGAASPAGSLTRMMERRYEAYKNVVVRPFFRDHFARLDRQIVLVDVLNALNGGATAVAELEAALAGVLGSFRLGRTGWLSGLVSRRIDRILFAATKADHLHHGDHDRLEAILSRIVARAAERAKFAGAKVDVLALASVRSTREASVTTAGETLPSIIGTPLPGETIDGRIFDGATEVALFPGDLPKNADDVFSSAAPRADVRFVRFRPPKLERTAEGLTLSLPHIRLDRALEFLLGDKLA